MNDKGLGPTIEPMSRYVFFNSEAQDVKVLTAARMAARSRGATVVKSLAGTMRLELAPAQVPEMAQNLPGWRYSAGPPRRHYLHLHGEQPPLNNSRAA